MKVIFTAGAIRDLQDIAEYIALDNPRRARTFVRELANKARDIGQNPNGFQSVSRYRDLGVRRRVYGSYLIYYRLFPSHVSITHFLHGARDLDDLQFQDG